jgi:hypothetical protein
MKKNFWVVGLAILILSGCDLLGGRPIAPLGVLAVAQLNSLSIKITWINVSNADSYDVYYETDSVSIQKLGNTSETSYIHEDLDPETTYTYYVRSKNSNGESGFSKSIPMKPLEFDNKPRAPLWVIATPKANSSIEVKWDNVSSATSFEVYYETNSSDRQKANTVTEASYTHTGLNSDTTYTYYVKSINSKGESNFSLKSNPTKPTPEIGNGGTSSSDAITITSSGVTGTLLTSSSVQWFTFTGTGNGTLSVKDKGNASGEYSADILADIYTTPPSGGNSGVFAKIKNLDASNVNLGTTNYTSITQNWGNGTTYYVKVYPYAGVFNSGTFWLSFN